jgi:PEP-CTERM motif
MNTNRNSARINGLVFALVLASLTGVAHAKLIGTYTIDYYHNAGGCINGFPNVDVPTAGNPFYCSYVPPGPVAIPAAPGLYTVKVVDVTQSGAIWNGDANGGSHIYMPTTLGGTLDFEHTGPDIVFYYWDWYPWDNDPSAHVTVDLYSHSTPEPSTAGLLGAGLLSIAGFLRRKLRP